MLFLPLSFADAQTSIYQEVHTSSNSGGQNVSSNSVEQNSATVEVMSTTIINGEEYNYYFSTSTPNGVEHQATIINGELVSGETIMPNDETHIEINTQGHREHENWITSMINLLNYLQLYVANTF